MGSGIFDLVEDVEKLDTASAQWAAIGTTLTDAGNDVTDGARAVVSAGWEGETCDSFEQHRRTLVKDLDLGGDLAGRIATHFTLAAGSVRVAQGKLDAQWATIINVPRSYVPSGEMYFNPRDEAEGKAVSAALDRAGEIRTALDTALDADRSAIQATVEKWQQIAARWSSVADGADPFDLPDDADGVGAITVGDRTIFNTGAGDDEVRIEIDPETGDQIVTINGQVHRVPAGQQVVIRVGEGNDTVTVPQGSDVDVTVLGGSGDDKVQGGDGRETVLGGSGDDNVFGGAGDDRVSAGAGRDYVDGQDGDDVLDGGTGDDTVYGVDGDDTISGGDGRDYLDGGSGDDQVDGGGEADIVSGGRDDDTLFGGSGSDVVYAGHGDDTAYGGSADPATADSPGDVVHAEAGDTTTGAEQRVTVEIKGVPDFIKIEGSPEFIARVQSDLETLASSPRGMLMLENLADHNDESGGLFGIGRDGLTIKEYFGDNNTAAQGTFGSATVEYNPSRDNSVDDRPPIVGLYHELAHVYDYFNDTSADGDYKGDDTADHGVENDEREAAGLPIDHDDDPDTPEILDPRHPKEYTENGLREELGWPERQHYS